MAEMKKEGLLIWVTGFFCAGKSTLARAAIMSVPGLIFAEAVTTRPRREKEENILNELRFVGKEEYASLRAGSALWDHSEVAGNYYGADIAVIREQLRRGINLICPVAPDILIVDEMKEAYSIQPILIWIDTPLDTANKRLAELRPDRSKHHYQTSKTRDTFLKTADFIFTPSGELETDIRDFIGLIRKIIQAK